MREFKTHSADETIALGRRLAGEVPEHGVVLLIGNLGAGKTTLAKGIADGRRVADPSEVSSPTFTLIHEYGDPVQLYHVDLYRVEDASELATLELDDLMDRDALILIEWGERFIKRMPVPRTEIRLYRTGDSERTVRVSEVI